MRDGPMLPSSMVQLQGFAKLQFSLAKDHVSTLPWQPNIAGVGSLPILLTFDYGKVRGQTKGLPERFSLFYSIKLLWKGSNTTSQVIFPDVEQNSSLVQTGANVAKSEGWEFQTAFADVYNVVLIILTWTSITFPGPVN